MKTRILAIALVLVGGSVGLALAADVEAAKSRNHVSRAAAYGTNQWTSALGRNPTGLVI